MKERPIDLKPHEVRGITAGRQTQIRRVVKPQPSKQLLDDYDRIRIKYGFNTTDGQMIADCFQSRFGKPGDRLWGRETWMDLSVVDGALGAAMYSATFGNAPEGGRWRPGILMPRWASRITLDVVAVRVERLQDISEADAIAEGVELGGPIGHLPTYLARPYSYHYAQLWDSINGDPHIERDDEGREIARRSFAWAANPWVWVIEFKRVEGGAE